MGGFNSGRKRKRNYVGIYPKLKASDLSVSGVFNLPEGAEGVISWAGFYKGKALVSKQSGLIVLNISAEQRADTQLCIRHSKTACNYGGHRTWLHCPYCQKRVTFLNSVSEYGYLGCNSCLKLTYLSRNGDVIDRLHTRIDRNDKKLSRLGKKAHKRTIERICSILMRDEIELEWRIEKRWLYPQLPASFYQDYGELLSSTEEN
ncbi:hypothetical protein HK25_12020 [Acetobacter sp. DsW_059]|nr:hypothetical protein HK25_12020 [Acetobacter sp. DsW_059]